jgi:hypothetical protein
MCQCQSSYSSCPIKIDKKNTFACGSLFKAEHWYKNWKPKQ